MLVYQRILENTRDRNDIPLGLGLVEANNIQHDSFLNTIGALCFWCFMWYPWILKSLKMQGIMGVYVWKNTSGPTNNIITYVLSWQQTPVLLLPFQSELAILQLDQPKHLEKPICRCWCRFHLWSISMTFFLRLNTTLGGETGSVKGQIWVPLGDYPNYTAMYVLCVV